MLDHCIYTPKHSPDFNFRKQGYVTVPFLMGAKAKKTYVSLKSKTEEILRRIYQIVSRVFQSFEIN